MLQIKIDNWQNAFSIEKYQMQGSPTYVKFTNAVLIYANFKLKNIRFISRP